MFWHYYLKVLFCVILLNYFERAMLYDIKVKLYINIYYLLLIFLILQGLPFWQQMENIP